jgi:alpha-1,6-mannosyltransferase
MSTLPVVTPRLRQSAAHAAIATVGAAATCALLACGTRIALAAAVDPHYLVPSGRRTGFPRWMRGPLTGHSQPLHLHAFIVLMAVMVGAWLCVLVCARRLPHAFVAGAIVIGTVLFALAPPLLSTDVFNYIAYGQMGPAGMNPYAHGPALLTGQPIYPYIGHLWQYTPSAYGPLFTLFTYLLAPLGIAGALWTIKAVTAAALLALVALVWVSARELGRDPRLAAVFVGLNPLVLVYAVGGAHNDVLVAAMLALALYLVVTKRPAGAGAAVVGAIAIKASAGLALPFVLLGARPRRRALAGALSAGVLVAGVSLLVFGSAITNMMGSLATEQRFRWMVVSIPNFVGHYSGVGMPGQTARTWLTAIAGFAIVVLIARSRGGRGWIEGAAAATLVVLATTEWVLPWYVVWVLPFAALVRGRAVPVVAVLLTALLMGMQLQHFAAAASVHHHNAHYLHARAREHRDAAFR